MPRLVQFLCRSEAGRVCVRGFGGVLLCLLALPPAAPQTAAERDQLLSLERSMEAGQQALYAGRYAEAESHFQAALEQAEKLPPDRPYLVTVLKGLAQAYQAQKRFAEAEAAFERALAIEEAALGPSDPGLVDLLNRLGALYTEMGRDDDAEAVLQRALLIEEAARGPNDPRLAPRLNRLGRFYTDVRRYDDAERTFERALALQENRPQADRFELSGTYKSYANMLRQRHPVRSRLPGSKARQLDGRALAVLPDGVRPPPKRGEDYFASIMVCLIGALPFLAGLHGLWRTLRSAHWPTTVGQVVASRLEIGEPNQWPRFRPLVIYGYVVDDTPYRGEAISFGLRGERTVERARAVLAQYPEGRSVQVHYSRWNPRVACLEPGRHVGFLLLAMTIGSLFLYLGIYVWYR